MTHEKSLAAATQLHACRFTNVVSSYRSTICVRSHSCDDRENLYTCM